MRLPKFLTPDTVTLRPHEGEGAYGDVFGEPRQLEHVKVDETMRLVRDATGSEIVSSARLFARPEHGPIPLDSEVTLPSGRVAKVISSALMRHPPAPEHYDVSLS